MPDTTKSFQCRHIHTTGRRCGSPSLRGEHLCYFHDTSRRPGAKADAEAIAAGYPIKLPVLHFDSFEDRPSVQHCLLEVMNRIACGAIDLKLAGILLYGLQIAANNLPPEPRPARAAPNHETQPLEPVSVEDITHDPDYGRLAPIAEMPEPATPRDPNRPSPMVEDFLKSMADEKEKYEREEAGRPPCTHCGRPGPPPKPAVVPTLQAVAA